MGPTPKVSAIIRAETVQSKPRSGADGGVGVGRELNKLSARRVQTLDKVGRHADGGGLYLVIDSHGKRWVMLYRLNGRRREMGLGGVAAVSLARARELAVEARRLISEHVDPIDARAGSQTRNEAPTFGDIATAYMADRETQWRNPIHKRQWRQTLEIQGAAIWSKAVDKITTDDVLGVLRPIWSKHSETARRLRGRIERVLDAARVAEHRGGENPARWTGHLAMLLPKPRKLTKGHHAALAYAKLPSFIARLRARPGSAARALEFLILTASRSGEVRGMRWEEIGGDIWTVPAGRMKSKREHRVPLSPRAIEILDDRREEGGLVFPGVRSGKVSSDMVFAALLRRMKLGEITTHGFRASFKDWATDETHVQREIIEAALAHLVGDETEQAYRRTDALAKRRHLMEAWAEFLSSTSGVSDKNSSSSE
jgi:integrase